MATAARKCSTPSDAMKLFKNGYGPGMVLFLGDGDCMCFDGSAAGVTEEEFHEVTHKAYWLVCLSSLH